MRSLKKFTINKNVLTAEEITEYANLNPGYIPTGDTITCEFTNYYGQECKEELILFKAADAKHRWTPYMMARQTSKYIIIARYDRYWKLTLNGELVSLDAEDNNTDQ
jgi:hypothetical protein